MHLLPDYVVKPTPLILIQAMGVVFMFLLWSGVTALILLISAYFGRMRKWTAFILFVPVPILTSVAILSAILQINLGPTLLTVAIWGLVLSGPLYLTGYLLVAPAAQNPIAKEYYRGLGYGIAMLAGATCGMGLRVPLAFPLSGFPSITTLAHGAGLAFAAFTSAASYFSISENVRKEIRESKAFVTSIGEAENQIAVERQVTQFYNRFTQMAQASGAVEAAAISRDEIYSYATALKKMQAR